MHYLHVCQIENQNPVVILAVSWIMDTVIADTATTIIIPFHFYFHIIFPLITNKSRPSHKTYKASLINRLLWSIKVLQRTELWLQYQEHHIMMMMMMMIYYSASIWNTNIWIQHSCLGIHKSKYLLKNSKSMLLQMERRVSIPHLCSGSFSWRISHENTSLLWYSCYREAWE